MKFRKIKNGLSRQRPQLVRAAAVPRPVDPSHRHGSASREPGRPAPEIASLGAHVHGRNVGEPIRDLAPETTKGATLADVAATSHAHPGMGEAVKEACLAALGKPLHA